MVYHPPDNRTEIITSRTIKDQLIDNWSVFTAPRYTQSAVLLRQVVCLSVCPWRWGIVITYM